MTLFTRSHRLKLLLLTFVYYSTTLIQLQKISNRKTNIFFRIYCTSWVESWLVVSWDIVKIFTSFLCTMVTSQSFSKNKTKCKKLIQLGHYLNPCTDVIIIITSTYVGPSSHIRLIIAETLWKFGFWHLFVPRPNTMPVSPSGRSQSPASFSPGPLDLS